MSTELQKKPSVKTIQGLLESDAFKTSVTKCLPKHLTPDRFIRVACTTLMRTPELAQCTQISFFNALLTLSQYGIEPDGRRAHLIPLNNFKTNCKEVQLIIDWKGYAELAMRSGLVSTIFMDVVCENDVFEYDTGRILTHRIDFRKDRGSMYAVYCIVKMKDGEPTCDVMQLQEVLDIRERSKSKDKGPWVTDFREMAKKTVFRRLSKRLTLSPEFRDAIDSDDDLESIRASKAKPIESTVAPFTITQNEPEQLPEPEPDDVPWGNSNPQQEPLPAEKTATKETIKEPAKESNDRPPQNELQVIVIESGFDFTIFQKWALDSGNIPNADSLSGFDEVPREVAERLLKAKTGLLKSLAMVKGAK